MTPHAQPSLFDRPIAARARREDPETSKRAAERATSSGLVGRHERLIVAAVADAPGSTGKELGERTGLGQVAVCRRLRALEERGWIVREDVGERELRVFPSAMARARRDPESDGMEREEGER